MINNYYAIFLTTFIIFIAWFGFWDAKKGFRNQLYQFLRLIIPMVLSGLVVKLLQILFKPSDPAVLYVIAGIGFIILFIVLFSIIKKSKTKYKPHLLDIILGLFMGICRGWIIMGFIVLFIDMITLKKFSGLISPVLIDSIVKPIRWILF